MSTRPETPERTVFDTFTPRQYAEHQAALCGCVGQLYRRGRTSLTPSTLEAAPEWHTVYRRMDPRRREERLRRARDEVQERLALAQADEELAPILTALLMLFSSLLAGAPLPDAAMDAIRVMALGQQAAENTRQPQPVQTPPRLGLGTDRQRHARKRPHLRVVGDPRRDREQGR